MDKNTNAQAANNGKVTIRIKDYFPRDRSGIEFFEVSRGAYEDLREFKKLIAGRERKSSSNTVTIKVKELYPHLCKYNTKITISSQLYSEQLDHVLNRNSVIIRISDFYPGNRSEQKFMEVSDSLCRTLALCRKIDENEEERQADNSDGLGFDEMTRGEIDGIYSEDSENETDNYMYVVQLFKPYGEKALRRAIMYFIKCLSVYQIAAVENISYEAARKGIRRMEEIVHDAGLECFGL